MKSGSRSLDLLRAWLKTCLLASHALLVQEAFDSPKNRFRSNVCHRLHSDPFENLEQAEEEERGEDLKQNPFVNSERRRKPGGRVGTKTKVFA